MGFNIQAWPHYEVVGSLKSMENIRNVFPTGKADHMNWFLAATSGVHGHGLSIDDIEKAWDITDTEDEAYCGRELTVLIVHPRLVVMKFGNVDIESKEDIAYLRGLISSTLTAVNNSQRGNALHVASDT